MTALAESEFKCQKPQDPVVWLATRKSKDGQPFLSARHLQAAEIFRSDFEDSQFLPSVTSRWEPVYLSRKERRLRVQSNPVMDQTGNLAAKQRFHEATQTLGSELSEFLLDTVCLYRGLEAMERRFEWPQRSAKIVLKIGLSRLIEHYQLNS